MAVSDQVCVPMDNREGVPVLSPGSRRLWGCGADLPRVPDAVPGVGYGISGMYVLVSGWLDPTNRSRPLYLVLRYLLALPGKARGCEKLTRCVWHDHDEPHDGPLPVNTHAGLLTSLQASISSRYMWPSWIRYRVAQPWGDCGGQRQQGGDAKGPARRNFLTFEFVWISCPLLSRSLLRTTS